MMEVDAPIEPSVELILMSGEKLTYESLSEWTVKDMFDDLFPKLTIIRQEEGLFIEDLLKEE